MSYPFKETRNRMLVTFSKQCIHLRRSLFWPPTSSRCRSCVLSLKTVSTIPIERDRQCKISWSVGRYAGSKNRSICGKKLRARVSMTRVTQGLKVLKLTISDSRAELLRFHAVMQPARLDRPRGLSVVRYTVRGMARRPLALERIR